MRALAKLWDLLPTAKQTAKIAARREAELWAKTYISNIKARYDSAQTTVDREKYWSAADYRSPRASMDYGIRRKIRSRARYECHESNSFARGMMLAKTNDVIGAKGPQLQVTTEDQILNRIIEKRFRQWAKRIGLACKLRTLYQAKLVDGEGFAEAIINQHVPDNQVKLDIRVSEADLWTDPSITMDINHNEVDGISFDEFGQPQMYKRLKQHPGDSTQWFSQLDFDVIPAEHVIHLYRCDRPDQKRGVSEFAPALPLFAELRRYRLAVLAAAETAANFAAVLESDSAAFNDDYGQAVEPGEPLIDLESRTAITLPQGWTLKQLKAEQPTTEFASFSQEIAAEIGRVLQMPQNIVIGSSRDFNFASGRLDYLLYHSSCDVDRADFELACLEKIFTWWLDEALLLNSVDPTFFGQTIAPREEIEHEWRFPPRKPIDEIKHAQAMKILYDMGRSSDTEWALESGVDLDAHYDAMQAMFVARKERDLPYPGSEDDIREKQKKLVTEEAFRNKLREAQELASDEIQEAPSAKD